MKEHKNLKNNIKIPKPNSNRESNHNNLIFNPNKFNYERLETLENKRKIKFNNDIDVQFRRSRSFKIENEDEDEEKNKNQINLKVNQRKGSIKSENNIILSDRKDNINNNLIHQNNNNKILNKNNLCNNNNTNHNKNKNHPQIINLNNKNNTIQNIKNNNSNNLINNNNTNNNNNNKNNNQINNNKDEIINNHSNNNDQNNNNNNNIQSQNNNNLNNLHNNLKIMIKKSQNPNMDKKIKIIPKTPSPYISSFAFNPLIKNYYQCENQNTLYQEKMEDKSYSNLTFLSKNNHLISLFGIYDGHNGKNISEYLYNNFDKILLNNIEKNNFNIEKSLLDSFKQVNKNIENIPNAKNSGSTATIILIDNNILYCANVGDSQCYYINKDKIIKLTDLHNCKNKDEVERVKKNKGLIFQNRVFGSLSLTRSIGDLDFKIYGVTYIPKINKEILKDNYSQFIILGSDGVWDVIDENYLWDNHKNFGKDSHFFCQKIVNDAILKGSQDNVSCIVIKL